MTEKQKDTFWGFIIVLMIIGNIYFSFNVKTYTVRITNMGSTGGIINKPIIYAEDSTDEYIFENTNNWIRLKFDKLDIQKDLRLDQTYMVKVVGTYFPIFNHYQNIIKIKEIN